MHGGRLPLVSVGVVAFFFNSPIRRPPNLVSDMEVDSDGDVDGDWASGSEEPISEEEFRPAHVLVEQRSYVVLSKPDVIAQSRDLIEGVRELLGLSSSAAAAALLRYFKWNRERLSAAYFANPEKTLRDVGMGSLALEVPPPGAPHIFTCKVCFEDVPMDTTFALGCGHRYCHQCWADDLEHQVASGPNCVFAHCMAPKCTELCHEECFKRIVSPALFERYREFLHRSFIDQNPNVKWCPSPGCDNSVKCDRRGRRQPVVCACGFAFCFQCADPEIGNHLPATCESVRAWNDKNKDESENVKWLMANTKRCPKCNKHIEKSAGCMHMTCRKGKPVGVFLFSFFLG